MVMIMMMVIVDDNLVVGITVAIISAQQIVQPTVGSLVFNGLIGRTVVVTCSITVAFRLDNLIGGISVVEHDGLVAVAVVVGESSRGGRLLTPIDDHFVTGVLLFRCKRIRMSWWWRWLGRSL